MDIKYPIQFDSEATLKEVQMLGYSIRLAAGVIGGDEVSGDFENLYEMEHLQIIIEHPKAAERGYPPLVFYVNDFLVDFPVMNDLQTMEGSGYLTAPITIV